MTATVELVEGKLRVGITIRGFDLTPQDAPIATPPWADFGYRTGFFVVDSNARSGAMPRPETFLSHRVLPSPLNPHQDVVHREEWQARRFPWDLSRAPSAEIRIAGPAVLVDGDVAVLIGWPGNHGPRKYSDERFEHLAKTDPAALVALLVSGDVPPARLTFAAEIAGRELPGDMVIDPLLALLRHERAVVREGAIYGLSRFLSNLSEPRVRKAVEALLRDPSPGVRAAAADELDACDDETLDGFHQELLG